LENQTKVNKKRYHQSTL